MWDNTCANIFFECIEEFEKKRIRYFIFRNHELLPTDNEAKDVDIVVDPKRLIEAKLILKKIYLKHGMNFYDEAIFHRLHCTHAICENGVKGIHIDLIGGYLVRGYEIYTFDELYINTEKYNGFYILNELYQGIMLFITKIFGYQNPYISDKYKKKINLIYSQNKEMFDKHLGNMFSRSVAGKYAECISQYNFEQIIESRKQFDKELKKFSRRKNFIKTLEGNVAFLWGRTERLLLRKNKYKRIIAIICKDNHIGKTIIDMLSKQINNIYVDDKKTQIHIFYKERYNRKILRKEIWNDIHYDKVSLLLSDEMKIVKGIVPSQMIFEISNNNDMEEKAESIIRNYLEVYLEKIK